MINPTLNHPQFLNMATTRKRKRAAGGRQFLTEDQFGNAIADLPLHSIAMLFGAGASRTSGVFLASEIVHDLCLTGYCREFGIDETSRDRVTRQEVLAWLELKDWLSKARITGESAYSAVFKQFKPTYEHQILYIKTLLEGKRPSPAYEAMAQLAHQGYFDLLLTTNFDPLFENCYRARYSYDLSLRVAANDAEYIQLTADRDKRQLCYLHGNLDGYSIANIDKDTRLLKRGISDALGRILDSYQLVVAGYSGQDRSVMGALARLASERPSCFRHGVIYWCRLPGESLSGPANDLLNSVPEGFEVEIHGFDRLIEKISKVTGVANDVFVPVKPPTFSDLREMHSEPAILNAAPLVSLPSTLLRYRTDLKKTAELEPFRDQYAWWQGTINDGFLWIIGDPGEIDKKLIKKCSSTPDAISLTNDSVMEYWNVFSELANNAIARVFLETHRLRVWKHNRFFFEKPQHADEKKIKYMSRKRRSELPVVWKEFDRGEDGKEVSYYCHETIRARVGRFRGKPVLQISPTRLFTIDGGAVWDSTTGRTAIGRSMSKVWNFSYGSLVLLWLDILARGADTVKIPFSADARKQDYLLTFHPRPISARQVRG